LNRPATGSTPCAANQGPAKAVNGSVVGGDADKWCSAVAGPKFLQVDLGSTRAIESYSVHHAQAGGESARLNTRDFDIQVSTDGTRFTTVAQVRGNTAAVSSQSVKATGRFVRLNVITPGQSGGRTARIYEFEVRNSPPPPEAGEWTPDVTYAAGAVVTFQGATFRCAQEHKSQTGWEPPNVPAFWQRL
jgi:hypothetical protein